MVPLTVSRCVNDEVKLIAGATVTMDVAASQKEAGKPIYSPTVGFACKQRGCKGWVLHSPASECQCPVPWCAHGLSVIMVLRMMQTADSLEDFQEKFRPYQKATSVSARVIFWDTVLYFNHTYRVKHAMAISVAAAAAAAGGLATAAAVVGVITISALGVDKVLSLLSSLGDSLDPEGARERESYRDSAPFGGDVFFQKLGALYARNNPEFNNVQYPLHSYYTWCAAKGIRQAANATRNATTGHTRVAVAAAKQARRQQRRRVAPVGAVPPVPPPPVAPPPAQSNSPKCKNGHPMALKTATRRTQLVCDGDGCSKSIQLGDKLYSCVECDFDFCESCVSTPVAPPTSPEPTRRRRSAASPTAPDSVERSIHSPGLNSPPAPDRQSGPTRRRDRR